MSFQTSHEKHLELCLERDRVLCSPEFARSPVMSKLLKFLVEHRLHDDEAKLKAYTVAVDGLGRTENFDPQSDSYPRVQIGRLRKMLDAFYAIEGGNTRLVVPIGCYEIEIASNTRIADLASEENPVQIGNSLYPIANRKGWSPAAKPMPIVIFAVACIVLLFWFVQPVAEKTPSTLRYPSLVIFAPNFSNQPRDADLANQTSNLIGSALSRFEGIDVHLADPNRDTHAQYGLKTNVINGARAEITIQLVQNNNGAMIWSRTIKADFGSEEMNLAIKKALIQIAGPYGAIAQNQKKILAGSMAVGYPCMVQFDGYLRYRDEKQLPPVIECIGKTLRAYPDDAFAMSRAAFAGHIAKRRKLENGQNMAADQLASRAVQINPQSANAKFALARTEFFRENCGAGKKLGYEAVELNPLDTRVMGYFSIYLSACNDPEGETFARRALELDPQVDLIVPSNLAFIKFAAGDTAAAYEISQQYLTGASREEPSLQTIGAISAAAMGRRREARILWRKVTKNFNMPADSDPQTVLSKFIINKQMVNRLGEAIQAANLDSAPANGMHR